MNQSVASTRHEIEECLEDLLNVYAIDRDGDYVFSLGSTLVWVIADELTVSKNPIVRVRALLLHNATPSPALYRFLALKNDQLLFGKLSARESDRDNIDIHFEHTLLATHLDRPELENAIRMVAGTADDLDDNLLAMAGGLLGGVVAQAIMADLPLRRTRSSSR